MTERVVGHYRVLEKIGGGSMGEVFRARDERLGRDVALKFIRSTSVNSPDHLRRFEQEARAAASLNHPNILVIYDVGFEAGTPYIVSELLEGQTLRQRLGQGPLPIRTATDYTLQLVQGLIAAHEGHIVHRDLKPENIFLTNSGRVKILDFGIAKLQDPEQDGPIESMPTVTKSGSVIGTVAYMSPEQLRGKPVDHRSDIFSTGAILYEMLTGQRAFKGESEADTMTAVLREEPPVANLDRASVPPTFRDIVGHCLEKDADRRFQSARDLGFALETISGHGAGGGFRFLSPWSTRARLLPWIACLLVLAAGVLVWELNPREGPRPSYSRVTFEEGTVFSARFAPDGQSMVYAAAWNGKPLRLYSTVGSSLHAQLLELADANLLSISRSQELAVLLHGVHSGHLETEGGTLAEAPLAGGSPREILTEVRYGDWDAKGELAVVHQTEGRSRLEYPIGHVLYESKGWISHMRFSPQHDKIAFMDHPAAYDDRGTICVMELSGKVRVLSPEFESESGLAWRADGSEIWFSAADKGNSRNLLAVNLSGKVRTVLDLPGSITLQDVSSDGRALITLNSERLAMESVLDDGKAETDISWHDWSVAKDISRDGQFVLFEDSSEAAGAGYSVALRKLDGSLPTRLGDGSAGGLSPDGKWAIAISTEKPGHVTLLPIGPGQPRAIETPGLEIENGSASFMGDGQHIVVEGNEPGHAGRCYLVELAGGKPKAITPEGTAGGKVSPDGKFVIGFQGNRATGLYPLNGGTPRSIPNLDAKFTPVQWSEDSLALYGYVPGEFPSHVYKVDIATGKQSLVHELRPTVPAGVVTIAPVVVSRDGTRYAYSYFQSLSVLYMVSGLH